MSKIKFLSLGFLFLIFLSTSCTKDEETKINEAQVLVEYLESTDSPAQKDFVNTDMPTMITATDLKTLNTTGGVYIIDIRSAADFATGYIANAHNVAASDVLTHIKGVDLTPYTKVAIVCYTGQTASFVASILRLLGYNKVFALKWGMASWHADFAGKWNTAVGSGNTYASQFVNTDTPKGAKGNLPELSTGKTTGQEILEVRAAAVLADGFTIASTTNATVFGSLTTNYIINYWPAAQYTDPGHIPGSMQYTPKETIKYTVDLTTLPTNKPVVCYCYTGQTSAFLVAYLRILGYDAKSILYGTNGMIYDKMGEYNVAHPDSKMAKFSDTEIMGYEYVQ